jgi:hypothetical protein
VKRPSTRRSRYNGVEACLIQRLEVPGAGHAEQRDRGGLGRGGEPGEETRMVWRRDQTPGVPTGGLQPQVAPGEPGRPQVGVTVYFRPHPETVPGT